MSKRGPIMNPQTQAAMKQDLIATVQANPKASIGGFGVSIVGCFIFMFIVYKLAGRLLSALDIFGIGGGLLKAGKNVKTGIKDVFKGEIGAHRKIKMNPSKCRVGDIYAKFRNKTDRCIKVAVTTKDNRVYLGQKATNACKNTKFHVCIPEGGYIKAKGTTDPKKTSFLSYDKLKQSGYNHEKDKKPINLRLPHLKTYVKFYIPGGKVYNK